jgi:tetratricopeptide (TPR) repeat protein
VTDHSPEPSPASAPLIWGNVPQRNKNFIGRQDLLGELERRAGSLEGPPATAIVPQALYGLGGVGKTQLAIEYAYRYAYKYHVVWWVPADQIAVIRSTLATLAPRLGLTDIPPGRVEDSVAAVLDALRQGKPFDRWLLIFDNADQPEIIRQFMPHGPGHVIVTSRNRGWDRFVEALEVDVFARQESLSYLQRRVKGIAQPDAEGLAEELGDLPLALDQAAALLTETVMTVDVYLRLLAEESDRILGENPAPSDYPLPVAAAWSLSVTRLQEQTPYAMELLQRCAFFGPAPIQLDLLDRGRYVLNPPLQDTLRDPILMSRAIRALGRYSLVRIDNYRRTLEVHRIIQRLIRNELDAEDQFHMRHEVHLLLAASDPGDPDTIANWPKYHDLLAHVGPAEVVTCRTDFVRRLAQNIVRYLYISGNYDSALASADKALARWTADSGEDDQSVLVMARLKAQILRAVGRYREAYELADKTFGRMRAVLGEDHEETLILMNGLCVDRRARGDFKGSLDLTKASLERHLRVFGSDHPRTFAAMNNLAEDLELNSEYAAARKLNEELYEEKLVFYLGDGHPLVLLTLNAIARVMREEGYFLEACQKARIAYEGYKDLVRQHVLPEGHPWVMQQIVDFSTALRAAGTDPESLELAQEAYDRYKRAFGQQHAATLAAAFNLANAQRISGDLDHAGQLLEMTEKQCGSVFGDDHAYTLASALNLSIIKRRRGEAEVARSRLAEIHARLSRPLGPNSHPALICAVNLAHAVSDLGDTAEAVSLGERALPKLTGLIGADHPHTLTCAANLALDLKAVGQPGRAADLARDTLERYRRRLGDEHPEVRAAAAGERQDLGIEVPVLF